MSNQDAVDLFSMGRPKVDTIQVTIRIPSAWEAEADLLAKILSANGLEHSRTDAFRIALRRGLDEIIRGSNYFYVHAWNGVNRFGALDAAPTEAEAIERCRELAADPATAAKGWRTLRVFRGRDEAPVFTTRVGAEEEPATPTRRTKKAK